jgi:chemotaxis protein MotB
MGPGGASTSVINLGGGLDARRSVTPISTGLGTPRDQQAQHDLAGNTTVEQAQKITEMAEHQKLESLMVELRQAIDKSQALKPFKDQLLLDITPEGLRIQIVDAQNRPMFDLGSAKLKSYTAEILHELAPYLNSVPNHLSLSGHTDTTPYTAQAGYNNWDLSADRANAARRALEAGGLAAGKVARVVGLSSVVLFNKSDPRAPINRRISIIVMTKEAEEAALKTDDSPAVGAAGLGQAIGAKAASPPAGASAGGASTVPGTTPATAPAGVPAATAPATAPAAPGGAAAAAAAPAAGATAAGATH